MAARFKYGTWDPGFRLNWGFEHCGETVSTDWMVKWHCCGLCGQMFHKPRPRKEEE